MVVGNKVTGDIESFPFVVNHLVIMMSHVNRLKTILMLVLAKLKLTDALSIDENYWLEDKRLQYFAIESRYERILSLIQDYVPFKP